MNDRGLYEAYLVEIVSRARAIEERCDTLLTREYASEAPRRLAGALRKVSAHLAREAQRVFASVDWAGEDLSRFADLRQLQSIDAVLRECSADLRYVHGAQSERLPWGTIPALESLFSEFAPGNRFLIRPKWNYNYTLATEDLQQKYREGLSEFGAAPKGTLDDLDKPLFRIAFPAVERENIVLHALLAHELGHALVGDVTNMQREVQFQEKVLSEVVAATDKFLERDQTLKSTGELFYPDVRKDRISFNLRLAWLFYQRGLVELLADAVAVFIFGPAALFAMLEIALQADFDELPEPRTGGYPPWRSRLRSALGILDRAGNVLFPLDSKIFRDDDSAARAKRVNSLLQAIRGVCADDTDINLIKMNSIANIAYQQLWRDLPQDIQRVGDLKAMNKAQRRFRSVAFRNTVVALIQRLDHGLLPNAVENKVEDRSPAHIVEILNAASLYRASLDTSFRQLEHIELEPALALRRRADRLTVKAIESAHLAHEYWANTKRKPVVATRAEHSAVRLVPRGGQEPRGFPGVLSKSELRTALEEPTLSKRLVVTPLLDPDESISAGSIDVRLGNQFLVFKKESFARLDIGEPDTASLERYQERHIKALREPFSLHPQQLVIGSTLEYIQIPTGLMAYVIGKSTWGRMGLIIATATKVDPGYRGCITLEIINEGEIPLVLYPGLPIAQLVVHRTGSDRYTGSYECATGPEFPDFRRKRTSWEFWTRPRQ